jgi:hypothetical protein
MADKAIEVVDTFKYLGILLDSRLDWNPRIDLRIKRAKKYLMMLHQGIGASWGPTPSITLWLWTGIVRPFLTWINSLGPKNLSGSNHQTPTPTASNGACSPYAATHTHCPTRDSIWLTSTGTPHTIPSVNYIHLP